VKTTGTESAFDLVGTWRLVRWEIEREGETRFPYGDDAIGQLVYTADGHMMGTITRRTRAPLDADHPRRASERSKAAAFDSLFHYAGRYRIEGDDVLHSVELAHNPGMVGTVQRRRMTPSGDRLMLSAMDGLDHHRLTWERAR
jgi:hypothetical protein